MSLLTIPGAVQAPLQGTVRWGLSQALPKGLMAAAARRGDLQGRLVARGGQPEELADIVAEIRADGALHAAKYGYITVDHAAVRSVLSSRDFRAGVDYSSAAGPLAAIGRWAGDPTLLGPLNPPSLLVIEPPEHTRCRKLVTSVFTARAVERLRSRAQEVADRLLDEIDPSGPVDLATAYCAQLPVTLIAEILGVPAEDRGRVLEFGHAAAPSLDLGLGFAEHRRVERALRSFDRWLTGHFERLRRDPGDDLLSQLVAARDAGEGLTTDELKATAGLVLAAGFETTVNLLTNGIALLREHPEQLETLRARPELWPNAVDEALRLDPPVLLTGRVARRATDVLGVPVGRGAFVTTLLAGANRDPAVFEDADRFDVTRPNARDHVSFSSGRHHCLGASLARMEGEIGLRTLFDRFPDLALLPGARRRPTRILQGYATLPARLAG